MLLHSEGADETKVVGSDGGTSVGDGVVFERIGLEGVFAEVAKVVAFIVGEDDGRCLCFEKEAVEGVGIVSIVL